jgi:hypothetical protein
MASKPCRARKSHALAFWRYLQVIEVWKNPSASRNYKHLGMIRGQCVCTEVIGEEAVLLLDSRHRNAILVLPSGRRVENGSEQCFSNCGPRASASPGSLLGSKSSSHTKELLNQKVREVGSSHLYLTSPQGNYDAY